MYLARILTQIETLGPGKRLVIWVKGCSKHCAGCANPELWSVSGSRNYNVKDIVQIIKNLYQASPFDGITISGGDPLEQYEELILLLEELNQLTEDILIYTGYTYQEVCKVIPKAELQKLLQQIAVLIDGRYVEALNTTDAVLRGSKNQKIIYVKESYRERYEEYLRDGRKIQNVYMGEQLISVGIHDRKEKEA